MSVGEVEGFSAHLFPNPSRGEVITISTAVDHLELFDAMGRRVTDQVEVEPAGAGVQFATATLTPGVYHILLLRGSAVAKVQIVLTD